VTLPRTVLAAILAALVATFGADAGARSESVSSPARIVFVSDRANPHPNKGAWVNLRYNDIYVMGADGRSVRRLTKNKAEDGDPACLSDGRVAYTRRSNGHASIYVRDMDGGDERQITAASKWASGPAWSPDGKWIAYVGDTGIHIIASDGKHSRQLTKRSSFEDLSPRWSPKGDQIGFTRQSPKDDYLVNLLVVSPRGGRPQTLIKNAYGDSFSWSPDGRHIAFSRPTKEDHSESRVWIVNLKTGHMRMLVDDPDAYGPAWSPDGATIALSTYSGIGLINVSGSGIRELIGAGVRGYVNSDPAWCP